MLSPVVHSVSQVAIYLKDKLESDGLLSRLTVQGEVANLRTVASGHSYFSLREDGSSIRCVMFRGRSGQEYLEEGTGRYWLAGISPSIPPPEKPICRSLPCCPSAPAPWPWSWRGSGSSWRPRACSILPASVRYPCFPRVIGVVTSSKWRGLAGHPECRQPAVSPGRHSGCRRRQCRAMWPPAQIAKAIAGLNDEGLVRRHHRGPWRRVAGRPVVLQF